MQQRRLQARRARRIQFGDHIRQKQNAFGMRIDLRRNRAIRIRVLLRSRGRIEIAAEDVRQIAGFTVAEKQSLRSDRSG